VSVADLLGVVTTALPGTEHRPGQIEMAQAVARAITERRHLVVQAGTGTGKTLAYLIPAILHETTVVVTTATKALQDQLATKDLPWLELHLPGGLSWAVLKGRSNYVCRQRLAELADRAQGQLELEELSGSVKGEVRRLAQWADQSPTGDMSELDWSPSDAAWRAVSVGSDECPGRSRCPQGDRCFAEAARDRAKEAQVVVVNTHLYGLHVASGGVMLPEHDVVIVDEAHLLEDIMSDTVGVSLGPGRFATLAVAVRKVIADADIAEGLHEVGSQLRALLSEQAGQRLGIPLPAEVTSVLISARLTVGEVLDVLRRADSEQDQFKQRRLRAQTLATRLAEDLDAAMAATETSVAFVSGNEVGTRLEIAPLDVGPTLANRVWGSTIGVLASATIPATLAQRVGLSMVQQPVDVMDVGSPFDYEQQSLLYCALQLPDVRSPEFAAASHAELIALIQAAGGRTLSLFTSWKAMDAAAEAVRAQVPYRVFTQRDLPKPALIREFSRDETSCLFATAGFFQGVDIPGRTLTLVTIDRLPFPRPDDPLLSARREQLGAAAFRVIDVPRAATLLAQAAGRLIRTRNDRGVVAVLDRRLGTANYRWDLIKALPPMRRTRHRADAETFLAQVASH
jgi:ATP-dependent DNA helicase DinG